jgi:hypothetical protein
VSAAEGRVARLELLHSLAKELGYAVFKNDRVLVVETESISIFPVTEASRTLARNNAAIRLGHALKPHIRFEVETIGDQDITHATAIVIGNSAWQN